ncbi:MAG: hypothetical protein M3Z43_00155 [Bifidobacterium sp.]|uniref:hypothetical protein n=1 Tax=Bifidobacterium apicola TaxID=3230739 RepID=UPI0036F3B0F3|nr:hypothetical protein [Bifidobacterium sp.]
MASSVSSMSFVFDLLAGGPMDWTGIDWSEEVDFSVCTDRAALDWTNEDWSDLDDADFADVAALCPSCCACVGTDAEVEAVVWASAVCSPSAAAMVGINMAIAMRPARNLPLKLPFATFLLLSADDRLGRRAGASSSGHPVDCI